MLLINVFKINLINISIILGITILFPLRVYSSESFFIINKNNDFAPPIIGETFSLIYTGNKSLSQIARRYGLGYIEMIEANQNIGKTISGKELIIPTSWIIPEVMDKGILINLAELWVYFFEPSGEDAIKVRTFPIGIGRSGYETPTGNFSITLRIESPTWFPPETSRKQRPNLPKAIPPGENNPLGHYWIQLSLKGYGIHGTNNQETIGKKVSLGCIRLYEKNIKWLFNNTYVGMPVKIVNIPVKFGYLNNKLYMEVHKNDLNEEEYYKVLQGIAFQEKFEQLNLKLLKDISNEASGIPTEILN